MPKYSTFQKAISMHVIAHTKPFLFSKYVSHTSLMITRIIAIVSLNKIFFWSVIGLFNNLTELENILLGIDLFYNGVLLLMFNK